MAHDHFGLWFDVACRRMAIPDHAHDGRPVASLGLAGKLRFGRFLGGDPGARLEVARHWDTGASFGFWYTYTDTSGFDDPFNRGYQDKGIFISVPLAMFTREDSAVKHSYAFSPWIRDVGQTVGHFNLLYEFLEDLLPAHVGEHVGEMKN